MANAVLITVLVGVGYMVLKYLVKKLARIEFKKTNYTTGIRKFLY